MVCSVNSRRSVLAAAFCCVMALGGYVAFGSADLPVIPQVKSWQPVARGVWKVPAAPGIASGDALSQIVAGQLAVDWRRVKGTAPANTGTDISLAVKPDADLGAEGYRLEIASGGVRLTAATRQGLFWGTRTLLQLVRAGDEVPCGTVVDKPDYPLRGAVLDVGRKYFPLSFLRDLVRELAYYKMNTFHVHLSDDRVADNLVYWAFRLESDVPGLTARDGSYTKDEFRAFVKEAAELGVNVIPEFDAPGHAMPFFKVRPELRLERGWDQLDVTKPQSLAFVKSVWDEYLDGADPVFSGPDVHIGADEYCRGSIEDYRGFVDGMIRHLQAKGKRVHMWGAFGTCTGQTAVAAGPEITVDLWHHKSYPPEKALSDGYSVTCVAGSSLYIVPGGPGYGDFPNVKRILTQWNPSVGDGGHPIPAGAPRLRGGKFAIWNDHVGNGITRDDVFERFFPLMCVVAEKTWCARSTNWVSYAARAEKAAEAPGLDLHDAANPDTLGWRKGGWTASFKLKAVDRADTLFADDFTKVRIFSCGRLGFSREDYDVEFDYVPPVGTWVSVCLTGTRDTTTLYVDGKLVQTLKPLRRFYRSPRWAYNQWFTLRFPTRSAVGRLSEVKGFKAVRKLEPPVPTTAP